MLYVLLYLAVTTCLVLYGVRKNNDAVLMVGVILIFLAACIDVS